MRCALLCGAGHSTLNGGGATANISVQANPAGLSAGFYFTELTIVSSAGTVEVPVTLLVQANPSLVLQPLG